MYTDGTGYLFLKGSPGSSNSLLYLHHQSTSSAHKMIQFYASGTAWGGIQMNGSASAPTFFTSSDRRLKENIQDYTNATDKIKALRLVSFNEKTDADKKEVVGFIADEFATVFPEWVEGEKDAVDEDGKPIYQSIATTNLINYLVGAVKESVLRIEKLEGK
jgi:Chaperone of endosialidase